MTEPSLLRKILKLNSFVGVGLLVCVVSVLVARPELMLFHPVETIEHTPAERGWQYQDVEITTDDGEVLTGWYLPGQGTNPSPAASVVLYCHGNAGNIGGRLAAIEGVLALGQAMLIFDYRGFGGSTGRATVPGTRIDVEAAWDWLIAQGWRPDQIVVWGRSIGGAIAIDRAASASAAGTPPKALIVEGSFTSTIELGRELHPYLPVAWFGDRIEYPSEQLIATVDAPILIGHAIDDELIGFHHGEALHAASGTPEALVELSGGHNGGSLCQPDHRGRVGEFLARL